MTNLVPESINEAVAAKNTKKLDKKLTKEGGEKVEQSSNDKCKNAIAALRKQIADVKKPGGANTTIEKRKKVQELEAKIAKWEAKCK
jgi:excinuclease UvrABC helicase subunit UvrB